MSDNTTTEVPVWGDELKDYIEIKTDGSPVWLEATNLLSWEFDDDKTEYEPEYINRRVSPKFTLAEKVSINYEKDLYRNNALDAFFADHEDDTDIPVRIARVRTWSGEHPNFSAKAAGFLLTPSQLDKNAPGEPVKLKGVLSMSDEKWTKGLFNIETLSFTQEGAVTPPAEEVPEPPSEQAAGPSTAEKPLDEMNLDELKAYAEAHEIDLTGKSLKADILAAIKAAESVE